MAKYWIRIAFLVFLILLMVAIIVAVFYVPKFIPIPTGSVSVEERLQRLLQNEQQRNPPRKELQLKDGSNHLMWFVQISDIHITILKRQYKRIVDLRDFASKVLDVINPTVVIASGDLTHASSQIFQSQQFEYEWRTYRNILDGANVSKKTIWLDVPGNHDLFNVPSLDSDKFLFRNYSMQGPKHRRSYATHVTAGGDKYSFIAVDPNQIPGTKRAFNFYGILNASDAHQLIDLAESSRQAGANYFIWFGHYPSSAILSVGRNNVHIGRIISHYPEGYIYLSGHLHTVGGLVEKMYSLQKQSYFDLELGDWKNNRLFRVAAFDHGIFSFVDVRHKEWPIILITNPKDSTLNINRESRRISTESTHIRILIFDPNKVVKCSARVNAEQPENCLPVTKNLFVRKWKPSKYTTGSHKIEVVVVTEDGREKTISQAFALDGSKARFPITGKLMLDHHHIVVLKALFLSVLAVLILSLSIMRIWHELTYAKKVPKPDLKRSVMRRFIRKLWIFSAVDRLFFPNLLIIFYILVGPWTICYVIDDYNGVVFLWGMFVKDQFFPGNISYLSGYFQLVYCNMPLIYIYANLAANRCDEFLRPDAKQQRSFASQLHITAPFFIILVTEVILGVCFTVANGVYSLFFGPLRIWLLPVYFMLFYFALTLPEHSLRSVLFELK